MSQSKSCLWGFSFTISFILSAIAWIKEHQPHFVTAPCEERICVSRQFPVKQKENPERFSAYTSNPVKPMPYSTKKPCCSTYSAKLSASHQHLFRSVHLLFSRFTASPIHPHSAAVLFLLLYLINAVKSILILFIPVMINCLHIIIPVQKI